jgi:hypothetical protein
MPIIDLSAIVSDQKAQPRSSILVDKVAEYTEDMERGDKFPPLVVFFDGAKYWLADGFHRYYASVGRGETKANCYVREGGLRDAIWYSLGANATHGMRRTNQDKQMAVAKALDDAEWSNLSDVEIAKQCAVAHSFVAKVRKDLAASLGMKQSEERTYTTKHGTPSTMNVANIGKARPKLDQQPNEIADTLEDIRRCIDFMPAPRDAAAAFPEDRRYFFPLSELEEMAKWMADFAAAWRAKMEGKARADAAG